MEEEVHERLVELAASIEKSMKYSLESRDEAFKEGCGWEACFLEGDILARREILKSLRKILKEMEV